METVDDKHQSVLNEFEDDIKSLSELCKKDKDACDAKGREIIEKFIMLQPEDKQDRYRAMQFAIDQELKHFIHPIAKLNHIQGMLNKQIFKLNDAWTSVADGTYTSPPAADIIEFKPKNKKNNI